MSVEDADDPYMYTTSLFWAVVTHALRGEFALAEDLSRKALKLCAERGFSAVAALHTVRMGILSALRGQAQAGLEQLRSGLETLARGAPGRPQTPPYILALGYELAGKPDEAFAALEQALEAVKRSGVEIELAPMHLLKGRLFEGRGNPEEAENSFRTSIEIARRQSAKSLELRATVSLARLLRDTSRRDEARAMLTEIYGWFTEGFDTADLKDAKQLLDELSSTRTQ